MAVVIRMPEVLANTAEAALEGWLIAVGESVSIGQPLAEVETEKAMVEYNSEVEGTLLRVLLEPGKSVAVGTPIAVVGDSTMSEAEVDALLAAAGAAVAQAAPEAPAAEAPAAVPVAKVAEGFAEAAPAASVDHGDRQFASPLVRRLAKERSLDLSAVAGTGPGGRIVRRDLDGLTAAPAPAAAPAASRPAPTAAGSAEFVEIPHSGMRRAIARRLTESKSTVPHFYLTADCRVDRLLELRKQVNEASPVKISVNDFVVKAVAAAFIDVPDANVTWTDTATRKYSGVDISIAVATDGGLLTPVLRGVEGLSLSGISSSIAELAGRARSGKLRQDELEGGSFAVTNLGMFGTTEFSAIINPPQSGILAVGAARQQPVIEDGALAIGTVMTVTLSADHRVLDGALAAQWLAAFVARIENPVSTLI